MKRNKLVIAMGLASAVLVGCNSSDSDKTEITAIDGYIVEGLVTMTCSNDDGTGTFTGRTDNIGIASIDTSPYSLADCTSLIEGDADTYDYDDPSTPWLHTMKTLPGLAVINPFTHIGALAVENDDTLDNAAALEEVYKMLGITDARALFIDFGTNNANRVANMSVLSESVFAAIVKIQAAAPDATAKNLVSIFKVVLPQVSAAVESYIADNLDVDLATVVFTLDIILPETIVFDADGNVITDLSGLVIAISHIDKPDKYVAPAATGATGGTGATGATGSGS